MTRRFIVAATLASGCTGSSEDTATSSDTSETTSTVADTGSGTTTSSTSSDATTTDTGSSTMGSTSHASTAGSTDTGDTTCPEGAEPSGFTEVDGCAEAVGEPFCSEGQAHVETGTMIDWEHDPPHSGPHYPMWALWGEHEQTVARGNWVHNLEHGGIVLLYLCPADCETELEVLRQVVAQRPELRILLTPDPDLTGDRFAAVSWTWVYRFDEPDLDTLLCFVDQHENHAPEDVP